MSTLPQDHILLKLSSIARAAGDIIMTYYKAPADAVLEKEDGSPVTKADREAERYIIGELERIFPGIPCIGEESACSNDRPSQLERYWCIDPLDGTREFISERPEFTVNIALVENGYPILGVIFAPALDVMYMGSLREGSFRSDKQGDLMKLPIYLEEKPFTVVISRAHPTAGAEAEFLEMLREKREEVDVKLLGSSLKFCMVADGSADIYFRAGRTMFWDSAAGHIIAKAAGSRVIKWESREELVYNTDSLENPSFFVYNPERTEGLI